MSWKDGVRQNLKISTNRGMLTLHQMWGLKTTDTEDGLPNVLRELSKSLKKNDDGLDFLDSSLTKTDPIAQLKFDLVKDIYLTKVAEEELALVSRENKKHNQELLALIKAKEFEEKGQKSIEALKAMLLPE